VIFLYFCISDRNHVLTGNGLEKKESSRTDVYQLQQMRGCDEYDNEGNKSTDRLMDIKARKTNTTSFLRPPQKSDLSSEEGSESGSDSKCMKSRKKEINPTTQSQNGIR
jgi:hypothetical protein